MKTLLTVLTALLIGFTAKSASTTKTTLPTNKKQNLSDKAVAWTCTVTQTQQYTAYGTNCQGLPISATSTQTCTASGTTCADAGSAASYCAFQLAFNEAVSYVNSQGDSCLPPAGGW